MEEVAAPSDLVLIDNPFSGLRITNSSLDNHSYTRTR